MSGRGLHIALTDGELAELGGLPSSEQADHVSETLEAQKFGTKDACETDKSWCYIHGALADCDPDGPLEVVEPAKPSLFSKLLGLASAHEIGDARYVVSGLEPILSSDDFYIGLVPQDRVGRVAADLAMISEEFLSQLVKRNHQKYAATGDPAEAAEYAVGWFSGLVEFYETAAKTGKNVIFTVDY